MKLTPTMRALLARLPAAFSGARGRVCFAQDLLTARALERRSLARQSGYCEYARTAAGDAALVREGAR